jgi:hypothetical protein
MGFEGCGAFDLNRERATIRESQNSREKSREYFSSSNALASVSSIRDLAPLGGDICNPFRVAIVGTGAAPEVQVLVQGLEAVTVKLLFHGKSL